jgi:hypothetical protein
MFIFRYLWYIRMKNKNYFILFSLLINSANLHAYDSPNKLLQEALLPQEAQLLDLTMIELGNHIHAFKIEIYNWTSWDEERKVYSYPQSHNARYLNAEINTFFDVTEDDSSCVGKQEVHFQNGTSSISNIWALEWMQDKKYIVHYHNNFRVYSTRDDQFVIANFR